MNDPGATGATFTVKAIHWPNGAEATGIDSAVVVASFATARFRAGVVTGGNVPAPGYEAVTEWAPAVRPVSVRLAAPPTRATVPSTVEPSKKVTLPVGSPDPGGVGL